MHLKGYRMKKYMAILFLALSILACSVGNSSQLVSTQTALTSTAEAISRLSTQSAWTSTPAAAPAPDFTAEIGPAGADFFSGPGEKYPRIGSIHGQVTIVGQAFQCAWFKVVSNSSASDSGWVSAEKLTYSINCKDVEVSDIPPLPSTPSFTPTPQPTATKTPPPLPTATQKPASDAPAPPAVGCMVNSNIIIQNRSGAPFTLYLTGPGSFTFYLSADEYSTVEVCSGTYDYYVEGTCNGSAASGSGRISDGDQVYFECN
jgi:uncharacterized protein YraI